MQRKAPDPQQAVATRLDTGTTGGSFSGRGGVFEHEPPSAPRRRAPRDRNVDRSTLFALAVVAAVGVAAILGEWIAPHAFAAQDMSRLLMPPSGSHLLGTDHLGRDVLSRLIVGARVSLSVGVLSVAIAAAIGVPLGAVAGYVGGRGDVAIMWLTDLLLAFPGLILAIAIASALGPSVTNAIIAIGIVGVPSFARLVRSTVLSMREWPFVDAARAIGAPPARIVGLHILPNVAALVVVRATLGIGFAILTEAGLSFIGLSAQPPQPSWGSMLNDGREVIRRAPYLAAAPGFCIMATVLAFNLLGDGLRDALDPRLRRRGES